MLDGLNFKEFVAFLPAFSSRTSLQQKIECRKYMFLRTIPSRPDSVFSACFNFVMLFL